MREIHIIINVEEALSVIMEKYVHIHVGHISNAIVVVS